MAVTAISSAISAGADLARMFAGAVSSAFQTAVSLFQQLASGVSSFVSRTLEANSEFERLSTLMRQVAGDEAPELMKQFEQFAKDTPFQLNDIINQFQTIKGLGGELGDNGQKALGDLAAAAGVSLNDLTEVFKSANQGQAAMVDKLAKAGGIKAVRDGGKLRMFGPGDKEGKLIDPSDTQALLEFFIAAGQADSVRGSMEKLAKTLGGRLSTLKDAVDAFYRAVGAGGFNAATKGLFGALSDGAPKAQRLGKTLGWLLGKVINFGTATFKALNLDKMLLTLEVFFAKLGMGFDGLAGSSGPEKLAALIEAPFRVLDALMLQLEGDNPVGEWLESFNTPEMRLISESLQRIMNMLSGIDGEGEAQKSMGTFADIAQQALFQVVTAVEVLVRNGPMLWGMFLGASAILMKFLTLLAMIGNISSMALDLLNQGLLKVFGVFDQGVALVNTLLDRIQQIPEMIEGAVTALGSLDLAGLAEGALGSVGLDISGLTNFLGSGSPGTVAGQVAGGPGATNNSTTTNNSSSTNVSVGNIQVGNPSDVGPTLGGLAAAGSGAGG